ncbi:N-6 DNA methylase [Metamycoplasma hyosynoviae]|uniref:N-6 DNA methylase n=1 Tax=Metamycoplasma hyosynoviae TaxID=29559 RepID=UPI000F4F6438|nr:N-6 DNA methylase [Metamycoplasma hyosynoviae]MDC8917003.1 N-6 DNA methylase [Metamycoplasma hyosynoviae]MDD1374105.1 N-6 DNA methylase [Metamycoplasma hyosynoviae]MDD7894085.1 N-6 DNA methylase [Metamycoplasma hyosynoviae]
MENMEAKKLLGQVFTPQFIVEKMINLISIKNPNLILEPSSGTGNFYFELIKKYDKKMLKQLKLIKK